MFKIGERRAMVMFQAGDELTLVNPWEPSLKRGDTALLTLIRVSNTTGDIVWTSGSYKGEQMYVSLYGYFEKAGGPW